MRRSKVFIASSTLAAPLAAALRECLESAAYDAVQWSSAGRRQAGIAIGETLRNAAQQFDLALVVLSREDLAPQRASDTDASRDNCLFELGFLSARMGRERCLLVHGARSDTLPDALAELICLRFEQPDDLSDTVACARAMETVVSELDTVVNLDAGAALRDQVPLLSHQGLFDRERPYARGGDLREGMVIVCDTQPQAGTEFALQVRANILEGTFYHYFFYFCDETVDKVMQALQVVLAASVIGEKKVEDFQARLDAVKREPERILEALRELAESRGLLVTLLADEPQFCFRFHNASDERFAKLYARYLDRGYLLWGVGSAATAMTKSVPKYLDDREHGRIFVPLKHYPLSESQMAALERSLLRAAARYFPGIEAETIRVCVGRGFG